MAYIALAEVVWVYRMIRTEEDRNCPAPPSFAYRAVRAYILPTSTLETLRSRVLTTNYVRMCRAGGVKRQGSDGAWLTMPALDCPSANAIHKTQKAATFPSPIYRILHRVRNKRRFAFYSRRQRRLMFAALVVLSENHPPPFSQHYQATA